jgi:hypothetical protein
MPKKVSAKRTREDLKPRPLPVAGKMLPYVSRIKLRANEPDGPEQQKAFEVMADILAKKKTPAGDKTRAIREARDAAAHHKLALARFNSGRDTAANALKDLEDLILKMAELAIAISLLPTTSKDYLNQKTADLMKEGIFDTEVFVELIDLLLDCLPNLSPQEDGDIARRIIERQEGESSPRVVRLWESVPAITRDCVERRIKTWPSRSGTDLLQGLPNLLREFRPIPRPGAPRSPLREYVKNIDRIWLRLNLTGRRQYDGVKDRHVKSPFHKFCDAALDSVGNPTAISIRQVSNLKQGAPPKRKRDKRLK